MAASMRDVPMSLWHDAEREREYWRAHDAELLAQYPDQFVAVRAGQVVAAAPTLTALLGQLAEVGLAPADVWTRYVTTHKLTAFL